MMEGKEALFTSARDGTGTDVWSTPLWLFNFLSGELGPFTLDAAASEANALCDEYFDGSPGFDGLAETWDGCVWCNPPYSDLGAWLKKGHDAVFEGKTAARVVMLIPARTDTKAFQAYASRGAVFFLKGRLVFGRTEVELERAARKALANRKVLNPTTAQFAVEIEKQKKQGAPFPSAVIVFDRELPPSCHFVDWRAP